MRLSKVKQSRNNELSVLERETFGEERRLLMIRTMPPLWYKMNSYFTLLLSISATEFED